MAVLETHIYSALTGSTLITDTTTRIYPVLSPQNPGYPHIIYTRVSGNQISGLSGYLNVEKPAIQIDTYSTGYAQAKTLADNIHTVLNASTTFRAILITDRDEYEDEVEKYRIIQEFSIIHNE